VMVADGGEDVAKLAIERCGIADAVGGEQRKAEVAGDLKGDTVAGFFLTMQMALEFDVDVVVAEDAGEAIDDAASFSRAAFLESGGERAFVAACQADEAGGMLLQFVFEDVAFFFSLRAKLHTGDELAEVLVAGAGGDQEGKFEFTTETQRHRGF